MRVTNNVSDIVAVPFLSCLPDKYVFVYRWRCCVFFFLARTLLISNLDVSHLVWGARSRASSPPSIAQTPKEHASYLTSVKFARDMLRLCARAGPIFENEPRCLFVQSPVYVFGDIHGNLEVNTQESRSSRGTTRTDERAGDEIKPSTV